MSEREPRRQRDRMTKISIALVLLLLAGLGGFFFIVPAQVEMGMNVTLNPSPYQASRRARELHKRLLIADLHADSLLWDRDLTERAVRGHVDVPRLIEGNVALQAFTVVTQTPRGRNIESNDASTDNITLLAIAQGWPVPAWGSLKERALYQATKLHDAARRSQGGLLLIKSSADLTAYLERRRHEPEVTAGFLGLEGAHALEGDVDNVDVLFDAGFRMIGLAHFFDNEMAGSAHGTGKGGLTAKGREMIRRMESRRMIVDLAHASAQTIEEVLAMATRPIVVSHSGVKGTCDNARNLSDEQLKGIAKTGGVVGIGYWDTAICGREAAAIVRAIRHAVNVAGIRHIGLGSDYDGAIAAPFDTTGLVQITEALLNDGFSEGEIEMIMGGNVIRLLRENLP